ncbi:6-phospho-beta-glucosidase [Alkaliphilus crotonatoxidans]
MKNGLKIVTIGGGSSYTPEIIEGFIKRYHELPVKEIWLVDIEEGREKLEIVGRLAQRMVKEAGIDCTVHLTLDRRKALKDADFVTTQFRVGLLEARIRDEKIPLRYNRIGQETTGAGGFAKALRTIPVILDICRDMEELCPDAWLVNFTNPSGIITETVLKHSNIKTVGLCNVPIVMKMMAAEILQARPEDVYMELVGLNHLIWGRKIYLKDQDVTQHALNLLAEGKSFTMKNIKDMGWSIEHIKALGAFPCPYHRYFYLPEKMLAEEMRAAREEGTRGEVVKKVEAALFELYKNPDLKVKPKELEKRGGQYYSDAACELINGIYNDKKIIMTVNIQNNGTISELSKDVAIETNAVIDCRGAHPLNAAPLSPAILGLLQSVKAYEELTIEAAVQGDREKALLALIANPLVQDALVAEKILADILAENKEYLPQFQ